MGECREGEPSAYEMVLSPCPPGRAERLPNMKKYFDIPMIYRIPHTLFR